MSEATNPPSLIIQFFELTKPYDKYITFAIIVLWIYVRSLIKAKEIEKQAKETKDQNGGTVEEKSLLDHFLPKAKPFEPQDVLNKEHLDTTGSERKPKEVVTESKNPEAKKNQ